MTIVRDDGLLFNDQELYVFLEGRLRQAQGDADRCDSKRLLSLPMEDIVGELEGRYRVDPIEFREDEIVVDQAETQLSASRLPDVEFMYGRNQSQVAGTRFSFHVPFAGDAALFALQPSTYTMNPPRGAVRGQELVVSFATLDPDSAALRQRFDAQFSVIKEWVKNQRPLIDDSARRLSGVVRQRLETRKEKLLKAANTVASIGFPLRKRDGMPQTYIAPDVRRKVQVSPSAASVPPFKPEPVLSDQDYEHILEVMQNMALVLERSPSAFKTMGEEDLRQHFLVQLNGHYDGTATGETFNVNGKTDILIRQDGKNLFIAECKFWKGPAGFSATIDQLLSYTSWRDSKTALVIFNRDVHMSTVLEKIPEVMRQHPNFKRDISRGQPAQFRALFSHANDPSRELTMTILAFDVPG